MFGLHGAGGKVIRRPHVALAALFNVQAALSFSARNYFRIFVRPARAGRWSAALVPAAAAMPTRAFPFSIAAPSLAGLAPGRVSLASGLRKPRGRGAGRPAPLQEPPPALRPASTACWSLLE